jgi:hypothetical protein
MRFPSHLEAIQVYLNIAQMSIHIFWVDFMWRVMWMQSFQHLWPLACLACGIILLLQLCSKQRRGELIHWLVMHGLHCTVCISWIHASHQRLAFHFHLSKGRQYSTNHLLDYIVKVEAICLMRTSSKWFFLLPYICLVISHVCAF